MSYHCITTVIFPITCTAISHVSQYNLKIYDSLYNVQNYYFYILFVIIPYIYFHFAFYNQIQKVLYYFSFIK